MRDNYYLSMFNYKYALAFLLSLTFLSNNAIAQYCTTGGPSTIYDSNLESFDITGANATSISYTGCPAVTGLEDQTALSVDLIVGASRGEIDINTVTQVGTNCCLAFMKL